jgi:hypothetical protein
MSFQQDGFQFDPIPTPDSLRGAKVYEVFYHQEFLATCGTLWAGGTPTIRLHSTMATSPPYRASI